MSVDPKKRNWWFTGVDAVAATTLAPVTIREPAEGKRAVVMGWNLSIGTARRLYFSTADDANFQPFGVCPINENQQQPDDFQGVTAPDTGIDVVMLLAVSGDCTVDGFFYGYDE